MEGSEIVFISLGVLLILFIFIAMIVTIVRAVKGETYVSSKMPIPLMPYDEAQFEDKTDIHTVFFEGV